MAACFTPTPTQPVRSAAEGRHGESLTTGLSAAECQDLADLLPFLACGEESAVHVFGTTLADALPQEARAMLSGIADDERRHAELLEALRQQLPAPRPLVPLRRLAYFFQRLECAEAAEHLARVAALDLAVCHLLQGLLGRGAALSRAPALSRALHALRQDEAGHVRQARALARQLGVSAAHQQGLDRQLAQRLAALLAPAQAALARLSAPAAMVAATSAASAA